MQLKRESTCIFVPQLKSRDWKTINNFKWNRWQNDTDSCSSQPTDIFIHTFSLWLVELKVWSVFWFAVPEDDKRLEEIWTGERVLLEPHSGGGGPLPADIRRLLHRKTARVQNRFPSVDRFSGDFPNFFISYFALVASRPICALLIVYMALVISAWKCAIYFQIMSPFSGQSQCLTTAHGMC